MSTLRYNYKNNESLKTSVNSNTNNVCMITDPRSPGVNNTKFCQKNQIYYLDDKDGASYIDGADFSCSAFKPGWGGPDFPTCECSVNIREGGILRTVPTNRYLNLGPDGRPDGSCMACPPGYYADKEKGINDEMGIVCKKSQNCDKITFNNKTIDGKRTNNKEILGNDTYPDPAQCVPKYMYCGSNGCHVDVKDATCGFGGLSSCPNNYGNAQKINEGGGISCPFFENIKRCEYMTQNVNPPYHPY